jgi:hypothetical protein
MDFDPYVSTHIGVHFQGTSIRLSDGAIASEDAWLLGTPAVGFMARTHSRMANLRAVTRPAREITAARIPTNGAARLRQPRTNTNPV